MFTYDLSDEKECSIVKITNVSLAWTYKFIIRIIHIHHQITYNVKIPTIFIRNNISKRAMHVALLDNYQCQAYTYKKKNEITFMNIK